MENNTDDKRDYNILEPTIDPNDWMEEYNSVKRKLEGFNSQSQEEKDLKLNFNDIFDQKSRLNILSGVTSYFGRSSDNKSFNDLTTLSFEVDRSLKNITKFEKRISQNAEKKV